MNVTLEELSKYSRLSKDQLKRIEEGNLDEYFKKAYARGFIKAYADCIGLDFDDTIRRYNEAIQKYFKLNKIGIIKRYRKLISIIIIIIASFIIINFIIQRPYLFPFGSKSPYIEEYYHEEMKPEKEKPDRVKKESKEQETIENTLKICADYTVVISITCEKGIISEEVLFPQNCNTYIFNEYIIFSITNTESIIIELNGNDITQKIVDSAQNGIINYKLQL